MVSELRCKKEIEDHILVGTSSMARIMKKCFKLLGNLIVTIKESILKVISKLSKELMDGSFFSALSSTFKDDNVWVINSGASRHMTGECSQLQTLSKEELLDQRYERLMSFGYC